MTSRRFWGLTPREYDAFLRIWEDARRFMAGMFFQMRADIHNGWMPRSDKRAWTAADFGAEKPRSKQSNKYPQAPDPLVLRMRLISQFGPAKGESEIIKMRGTGQPMPKPKVN